MLRDLLLLHNDGLSQAYPEDEIETGGEQVFVNEHILVYLYPLHVERLLQEEKFNFVLLLI